MRIYELIRVILGLQFRYTAYKRLQDYFLKEREQLFERENFEREHLESALPKVFRSNG